jgi:hypothetical protein
VFCVQIMCGGCTVCRVVLWGVVCRVVLYVGLCVGSVGLCCVCGVV